MKRSLLCLIIEIIALLFLSCLCGCQEGKGQTQKKLFYDAFGNSYYAEEEKTFSKYSNSKYEGGKEVASGEYVLFPTSSDTAKYKITSDEYGFNILREEYIGAIWTIFIDDGEYIFLEKCYMVKIEETPSFSESNFKISQFDGKKTRLKVGYHVPSGEYAFKGDVKIFKDLAQTNENNTSLKVERSMVCFGDGSYSSSDSDFTLCSIYDGEYCEITSIYGFRIKSFIPLSETAPIDKIKENGVYKVGLHLPNGTYTVKSKAQYWSFIDAWFYDGSIEIYEDYKLVNKIEVKKNEEMDILLQDGQVIVFRSIEILHRTNLGD